MEYVYENDVTKVGGNLQKTVAYLLSLHKNEYEWNMLGIKVIGTKEALPIPDGIYEYGDAYMIGNKTDGFEMWIYTRADEFHTDAYWFDIGQFPKPGPQGPAGPGSELGDIANINLSAPIDVAIFDTSSGISISGVGKITDTSNNEYDISTEYIVPLVPGKYIDMDTDPSNSKVQVAVNDTKLALDYYKIDKTNNFLSVPLWDGTKQTATYLTEGASPYSVVKRNADSNTSFSTVGIDALSSKGNYDSTRISIYQLSYACRSSDTEVAVSKTSTDTGTISVDTLTHLQNYPQVHIQYNNQTYYRMDPLNAPDGTLNFIHLDAVQTGGGYAARGKCFSITTSTRAWQVVDMSFGPHTHQLTITDNVTNAKTYMTIVSNRTNVYTASDLITEIGERSFPCTCDSVQNDSIYAGEITADGNNQFTVRYSNNQEFYMTDSQVMITDYVL